MNATEAISNIVKMLGLQFKKETFKSTYLVDGTTEVTNNMEDDFQPGQTLYIVKESTLVPAPEGTHETRDNVSITLDSESVIIAIANKDVENEAEVEQDDDMGMMDYTKAEDAEGNILESDTFDVGEKVYTINKETGDKEPCKDGEKQVVLKDESGNEVKIRIEVKDGVIVQRENVEGMMKPEEMNTDFSKDIQDIKLSINNLLELVGSMNGKFKTDINTIKTDLDNFKNSPERKSVVEKKTYTESFSDYKLDIIKSLRK